jgi:hypothetical protein
MRAKRRRCVPSRRFGTGGGGGSWRGLPRRRSRVGKRGGGGGENPKKRCGGRAEGERERGGKASEDADGWMDNTGG